MIICSIQEDTGCDALTGDLPLLQDEIDIEEFMLESNTEKLYRVDWRKIDLLFSKGVRRRAIISNAAK